MLLLLVSALFYFSDRNDSNPILQESELINAIQSKEKEKKNNSQPTQVEPQKTTSLTQAASQNNSPTPKPIHKLDTNGSAPLQYQSTQLENRNTSTPVTIQTPISIRKQFTKTTNDLEKTTATQNTQQHITQNFSTSTNQVLEKYNQNTQSTIVTKKLMPSLKLLEFDNPIGLLDYDRALFSIAFNEQEKPLIQKAKIDNKKGRLAIDFYSGVFAINRTLINNEGVNSIFDNKSNDEVPLELVSIGSQLQYTWPNNLYTKIGIEFQSINEKYSHHQSTILDLSLIHI